MKWIKSKRSMKRGQCLFIDRVSGKEVFEYFDVGMPGRLANFIRELPPPGANLWHEQMLVDLAGIPAT